MQSVYSILVAMGLRTLIGDDWGERGGEREGERGGERGAGEAG